MAEYIIPQCGCQLHINGTIKYCPKHAAAPDLYEACKAVKWCAEQQLINSSIKVNWQQIISDLEQVIAKVERG